jgi:hypothetical protein
MTSQLLANLEAREADVRRARTNQAAYIAVTPEELDQLCRAARQAETALVPATLQEAAHARAADLHDRVHEAAALVEYNSGKPAGWAPEDSIPILADELARFAHEWCEQVTRAVSPANGSTRRSE